MMEKNNPKQEVEAIKNNEYKQRIKATLEKSNIRNNPAKAASPNVNSQKNSDDNCKLKILWFILFYFTFIKSWGETLNREKIWRI